MEGTTLRVLVDGVQLIITNDNRITIPGRAGIVLGCAANASLTTVTDTTGTSLDDLAITSGTSGAIDSAGWSPGDYVNGTALAGTGALAVDPNKASSFDGVDDYVQTTSTRQFPVGASPRSVELWFRTTSPARQVLFGYGSLAAPGQEFGLWLDAGGTSLTAWGNGVGYDRTFAVGSALDDGTWHQVVKTYDGSTITVYVDGVALAPQAATRDTVLDSYGFTIGAVLDPSGTESHSGWFDGLIDEVSLYGVALSAAEVSFHYQLGTVH